MTDWIAYLEADPKSEPYLSIAAAWKADKARLAEAERLLETASAQIERRNCVISQTKARLAEAEALRKDAERWRHEWQRECADTDLLLQGMGLCPSEYRSEGGSLLLGRISHKLKQRGGLS